MTRPAVATVSRVCRHGARRVVLQTPDLATAVATAAAIGYPARHISVIVTASTVDAERK